MHNRLSVEAAIHDVSIAHIAEEGLLTWFHSEWLMNPRPLAADVWVFSPDFQRILVVEHRWRGLVPPGDEWNRARRRARAQLASLRKRPASNSLLPTARLSLLLVPTGRTGQRH